MSHISDFPCRLWLLLLFLVLWGLSVIGHASTIDITLQHVPTVIFVAILVGRGVRHPISNLSYTMFFLFLCLHLIGARYLYSDVPYNQWFTNLLGVDLNETFGFQRNHYDRFVHLSFGILLFFPAREMSIRWMKVQPSWSFFFGVCLIIVASSIYELVEWGVAMVMSPDRAETYNGQQGDIWDAHKDAALAMIGATFSALLVVGMRWFRSRSKAS